MKIISFDGIPVKFDALGVIARDMVRKYNKDGYKFHLDYGQGLIALQIDEQNKIVNNTPFKICNEKLVLSTLKFPRNGKLARIIQHHVKFPVGWKDLQNHILPEIQSQTTSCAFMNSDSTLVIVDESGLIKFHEITLPYNEILIKETVEFQLPLQDGKQAIKESLKSLTHEKFIKPTGLSAQEYYGKFHKGFDPNISLLRALAIPLIQIHKEISDSDGQTDSFVEADMCPFFKDNAPNENGVWKHEGKRWWKCPQGHSVRAPTNGKKIFCEFCKSEKEL